MGAEKTGYGGIDIAKFIASILVVAIHVLPFSGNAGFYYDHCLARIADPLFFIITSYLMFSRAFRQGLAWHSLGRYMKRVGTLYACWVLIYTPVIWYRTWQEHGGAGLAKAVRVAAAYLWKVFLSGPYGALWFLTALLIAIPLTFFVTKRLGPKWCVALSFPFFLLTVLQMEYTNLVADVGAVQYLVRLVTVAFGWLGNGLTYGFFFCALGMYAASGADHARSLRSDVLCLAVSGALLVCESTALREYDFGSKSYGAMFFLIPVSYFLFQCLRRIPLKSGGICLWLRKSSILIFTMHYGIWELLCHLLRGSGWFMQSTTCQYAMALTVTLAVAAVVIRLSERTGFSWLKKLY